jgi:beta-glucosidase
MAVTQFMRYWWNWWFLNRIRKQQDFIGFNYYFTDYYQNFKKVSPKAPVSDLGWYMEPEGLHPLLSRVWAHYKKPIIITENGLADSNDENRQWWIEETIVAMERALSEGIDLRGYFHWSLLDNFEWKYGWWPEFGLVKVNRRDMSRTVRPSAKWYAAKIAALRKGSQPTQENTK